MTEDRRGNVVQLPGSAPIDIFRPFYVSQLEGYTPPRAGACCS